MLIEYTILIELNFDKKEKRKKCVPSRCNSTIMMVILIIIIIIMMVISSIS